MRYFMSSDGEQVVADPDPDLSWYEHKAAREVHLVELPEVARDGHYWLVTGAESSVPRRAYTYDQAADLDLIEQVALDSLAAVRAERVWRAGVQAEAERLAAIKREAREGAERILARLEADPITRHLAARQVLERALRDGVIEEKSS